jgi:hypothetical protein
MDAYAEQQGVVAAALGEALVQDYDGLLRIAPALPSGWDADTTVYIQGGAGATGAMGSRWPRCRR